MSERILLAGGGTGGHLYPALNLAGAIRRVRPEANVLLVGAQRGVEAKILPEAGLPYRLLPMEPLYRSRPWRNWRLARSGPAVAAGLRRVFRDFDPQLVVGTGGYASAPALLAGLLSGRPTALQEQNAFPGLVLRSLAPVVNQVHLGYPEAAERLRTGSRTKLFAYGNPVAVDEPSRPFDWPDPPVLGVIGGSQGARGLNQRLLSDLADATDWPEGLSIVWVTGPTHHSEVAAATACLPFAPRIISVPFISGLGAQLSRLTLAVCRSGAMFCSELAVSGVPAVFVPFPAAAADHQWHNALALSDAGAAVVLEERSVRPGELWRTVLRLLRDDERLSLMAGAMRERGRPDAADRTVAELLRLLSSGRGGNGA